MYLCPVIVCKNQGCESRPIRLPYANPPAVSDSRPDWPNSDWKPLIACFACGHSYVYAADDVHWGAFETQELGRWKTWAKYVFQCPHTNCGLPIEFYVFIEGTIEPERLWERVHAAHQKPSCEKQHALTPEAVRLSATTVDEISVPKRTRQAS
jgi:hypothetical protein